MLRVGYLFALITLVFSVACSEKKKAEGKVSTIAPITSQSKTTSPVNSNEQKQAIEDSLIDQSFTVNDTDTIQVSQYRLFFSPYRLISFPDYYQDHKERAHVTKGIDNSHEYAKAVEKYLLTKYDHLFAADDSTLTLKLDNGQTVSLPKWNAKNEIGYNLEHFFPEQNYFLVHVQYYEGVSWLLVNKKNGFKKYITGLPYFSPEGDALITGNIDLEAGYDFNGLEFLKVNGDTLSTEWTLKMSNKWGPSEIKWLNAFTVAIEKVTFEERLNDVPRKHKTSLLTFSKKK